MTRELPDDLKGLSDEEKEQRRDRLVEESQEAARELEAEQEELLDSLTEEHGGDLLETAVTLPGDNPATVECIVNGDLIDRIGHIDAVMNEFNTGDPSPGDMAKISETMDEAAAILADVTAETKYSKDVFFEIYRRYGPQALGEHIEAVFEAIEAEQKRRAGDVDGFRKK